MPQHPLRAAVAATLDRLKPTDAGLVHAASLGSTKLSDASVIRRLKHILDTECTHASRNKKQCFLELFSGTGRVSSYVRSLGFAVISFDIFFGPEFDLLRPCVLQLINGWIRGGVILGCYFGTPCSSWSLARRGPATSSWGPLRSQDYIYGLPGLSAKDQAKVQIGNETMRTTVKIISQCLKFGLPCILENPINSRLFHAPEILSLQQHPSYLRHCCDQCRFSSAWRKRTGIWTWNCQDSVVLDHRCTGSKGFCSSSQIKHVVLSGSAPGTNQLFTALASEYPRSFAKVLARLLVDSYDALIDSKIHCLLRL